MPHTLTKPHKNTKIKFWFSLTGLVMLNKKPILKPEIKNTIAFKSQFLLFFIKIIMEAMIIP